MHSHELLKHETSTLTFRETELLQGEKDLRKETSNFDFGSLVLMFYYHILLY